MTTLNMRLTQPGVLTTVGPTYATQQNTDLSLIDLHDHTTGKGVLIPVSGLNINANISYTGFGATNLSYASFTAQALPSATVHPASFMVNAAGDVYYENTSGNQIQLTSGGAIVANGTGAANGFYGFGGTGYATPVQAGYDQLVSQYRFGNTNADPNGATGTFATLAYGAAYIKANTASPIAVGTAWAGKVPTTGWALGYLVAGSTVNGFGQAFTLAFDYPTSTGSFARVPLRIEPIHASPAADMSWCLYLNYGRNGTLAGGIGVPGDAAMYVGGEATTNVAGNSRVILRLASNSGVLTSPPVAGDGGAIEFSSVTAVGDYTQTKTGRIESVWRTAALTDAGINIRGASSGSVITQANAGFQLMNFGGTDYIGLGTAPVNGIRLTVSGASSLIGAVTGITSLTTTGTATLAALSVGATSAFTGATTFSSAMTGLTASFSGDAAAATFTPTSGPSTGTKYQVNQSTVPYAWANSTNVGSILRGYNCSLAAHGSSGVYDYTLNAAISASASVVVSMTDTSTGTVRARFTSSTNVRVEAFDSSFAAADRAHNFVVLGA